MTDDVKLFLEINQDKTKEWIKTHRDTEIMDTPLWVLIGLGVMILEEEEKK